MPRKQPKPTTHPALLAIRDAAQRFKLAHECSRLVDSDLEHDARAIASYPDRPFAWAIGAHGTYMVKVGAPHDCELAIRYRQDGAEIRSEQVDAYTLRAIAETAAPGDLYLWDGTALLACRDADQLVERYKAATFRQALAELKRRAEAEGGSIQFSDVNERIMLVEQELGVSQ